MQVGERVVAAHSDIGFYPGANDGQERGADGRIHADAVGVSSARGRNDDIGWFAARQPGVMRFLEDRLGGYATALCSRDEVLAIALQAAYKIAAMFADQHGQPPPRLSPHQLEQAEEAVLQAVSEGHPGYAERQPSLAAWLAAVVTDPPRPLSRDEKRALALTLAAIVASFDAAITAAADNSLDTGDLLLT